MNIILVPLIMWLNTNILLESLLTTLTGPHSWTDIALWSSDLRCKWQVCQAWWGVTRQTVMMAQRWLSRLPVTDCTTVFIFVQFCLVRFSLVASKINLLQSRSNVWQQEWTTLSTSQNKNKYNIFFRSSWMLLTETIKLRLSSCNHHIYLFLVSLTIDIGSHLSPCSCHIVPLFRFIIFKVYDTISDTPTQRLNLCDILHSL